MTNLAIASRTEDHAWYLPAIRGDEALKYGLHEAAFIARLRKWVSYNKAHHHDSLHNDGDRTWSYSTQEEIGRDLALTVKQVRVVVANLIKAGVIMTDSRFRMTIKWRDRRLWYAFHDEGAFLRSSPPAPDREAPPPFRAVPVPERAFVSIQQDNQPETQPPTPGALLISLESPMEGGDMSDVTKSRIDAFRAVREAGATKTKTAPDESDDRRGDLARRRSRDENVGRPRKSKKAGAAPKAPRAPLQSAVFDAWRNAMNAKGIPTVQVPERRDLEDAQRIVEKAGGEAQAIAYAVWTVENWAALTKKFLKLDDYGMTFGTISGGWMRSLFPESCKAIAPKVQGSDFFVKYMGLAAEDRAEMDPTIPANKSQFQGFDELSRAIDAYHDAQHEIFLRKKSKNAN